MINNEKQNLIFFLYARKSEENEERQIQSIPDQIDRLKSLASTLKIEIKEILTEAKSAKKPYNRPVFTEMIQRIKKGEANGILCWQTNRLFRNPVDYGTISWMLQEGVIKCIQTMDRQFLSDDNVLLLGVEASMANQFIVDLRKGVHRGIESKLNKGWAPIVAPIGYLNTKTQVRGENYILRDPERFPLVRKAWDLMLTGTTTPPKILEVMNHEWGLRTKKTRRKGGTPLTRSALYRIFTDIFYTGLFRYMGKVYQGKHEAMITSDEYDRVQMLLGRKGKPRQQTHVFPFTGMIRCGECGSAITAIEKLKMNKASDKVKTYVYYYCTRRKSGVTCTQKKYLSEKQLEGQIAEKLQSYEISSDFKEWTLQTLRESKDIVVSERMKIKENQQKALSELQQQLDNLTKMRYRGLINDEEFTKERIELQNEVTTLTQALNSSRPEERWNEVAERAFEFVYNAPHILKTDDIRAKKEVLLGLGKNFTLKDKKLLISLNEWLVPIADHRPTIEGKIKELEPDKNIEPSIRNEIIASLRLLLCALIDDVRTALLTKDISTVCIPTLPYPQKSNPP